MLLTRRFRLDHEQVLDFIVPVLQLDAGKQNMLAVAYAVRLAKEIGAEVFLGICQSNQVSHTGADAVTMRSLGYLGNPPL